MIFAASNISLSSLILIPESTSASGIFGVITLAKGKSFSCIDFIALFSIRFDPLVATITGSSTIFFTLYFTSSYSIASTISGEDTMPIFIASGKISSKIISNWLLTNSGATFTIPVTPVVFCAVSAVMALIAYTLFAVIVFISACIPAPPIESLPAIVNTFFISCPLN